MIQHEFMSAEPFPHLVLDDFAPEATLRAVAAGFDFVSRDAWPRARARFVARADEPHDAAKEAARLARSRGGLFNSGAP